MTHIRTKNDWMRSPEDREIKTYMQTDRHSRRERETRKTSFRKRKNSIRMNVCRWVESWSLEFVLFSLWDNSELCDPRQQNGGSRSTHCDSSISHCGWLWPKAELSNWKIDDSIRYIATLIWPWSIIRRLIRFWLYTDLEVDNIYNLRRQVYKPIQWFIASLRWPPGLNICFRSLQCSIRLSDVWQIYLNTSNKRVEPTWWSTHMQRTPNVDLCYVFACQVNHRYLRHIELQMANAFISSRPLKPAVDRLMASLSIRSIKRFFLKSFGKWSVIPKI